MSELTPPRYIRPSDMKLHFGITRSATYELIKEDKIKSIVVKKRGNTRGVRLIEYQSVVDYLVSLDGEEDC